MTRIKHLAVAGLVTAVTMAGVLSAPVSAATGPFDGCREVIFYTNAKGLPDYRCVPYTWWQRLTRR